MLSGLPALARKLRGSAVLILAYHNVVPDDADGGVGQPSLHLARSRFAAQLDLLCRTHDVVALSEILTSQTGRVSRRPRAVITFDDAYRGAVSIGIQETVKRGLPATIFVPPGCLEDRALWWDAYARADDGTPLGSLGRKGIHELRGNEDDIRKAASSAGIHATDVPRYMRTATVSELEAATQNSGVTLGSHSWSHANLAVLQPDLLDAELTRSLRWLQERFEAAIPWIAYPYGISSPAVELAAAHAGYVGGLSVTSGWVVDFVNRPFLLPRLDVPAGASIEGFGLRIAGLLS